MHQVMRGELVRRAVAQHGRPHAEEQHACPLAAAPALLQTRVDQTPVHTVKTFSTSTDNQGLEALHAFRLRVRQWLKLGTHRLKTSTLYNCMCLKGRGKNVEDIPYDDSWLS